MQRNELKTAILDIITEIVPDEDLTGIKDDIPFRDQIELDSMDFLDFVMEIRKRYRIDVPETDFTNLSTINQCIDYLLPKIAAARA